MKFYNTNEVNETPARVELLEERMSSYVESHAREEVLNELLLKQALRNTAFKSPADHNRTPDNVL